MGIPEVRGNIVLVIMNKLELVRTLRKIAESEGCHLTLRAASKIANWLKEGTAYDITSYLKKEDIGNTRS